jgi:lysophospholipase L1-like esterase
VDATESTRLGNVLVEAGGSSARSARLTGRAALPAVTEGQQVFRARADTLPPYFATRELSASVPATGELLLPLTLSIGANEPGTYMTFGDSITDGDGSFDLLGYTRPLGERLRAEWATATMIKNGVQGSKSFQGAERIEGDLARERPGAVLILYGTNDWNRCSDVDSCYTQDSVRSMLRAAKAAQTLPYLGLIIPVNTGFSANAPPSRNEWVAAMNERLKVIAREEGVPVADTFGAISAAAPQGDFSELYIDHVHPNDRGHRLIADAFFQAVTGLPANMTTTQGLSTPRATTANPPGGLAYGFPDD